MKKLSCISLGTLGCRLAGRRVLSLLTALAGVAAGPAAMAQPAASPAPVVAPAPSAGQWLLARQHLAWQAQGQAASADPARVKRWAPVRVSPQWQSAAGHAAPMDMAVAMDADSGELIWLQAQGAKAQRLGRWPGPSFGVEGLCAQLDAQGHLQVLLLSGEGLSEQWLLGQAPAAGQALVRAEAPTLRQLATPVNARRCEAEAVAGRWLVPEPGVGLWHWMADPERLDRQRWAPAAGAPQDEASLLAQGLAELQRQAQDRAGTRGVVVMPLRQTPQVRGLGDAADDPAIWRHPKDPRQSRVLGTDKKTGLAVYDLQGRERQFLPVGRVNNVDLRQGLRIGGQMLDLAVATQRDTGELVVWEISPQGRLSERLRWPSQLDDPYGLCSARGPDGSFHVFANNKEGHLMQWRLTRVKGRWQGELLARHRFAGQVEGCVADEAGQQLFIGQEKAGVWRLPLAADGRMGEPQMVLAAGPELVPDVEGMAVMRQGGQAWLVVSSQGDDHYVVLQAQAPYAVQGRFRIGLNAKLGIDGSSETDGLDVAPGAFGPEFPEGLLVVQDGHKRWPTGRQNFKYVSWRDVRGALGLR